MNNRNNETWERSGHGYGYGGGSSSWRRGHDNMNSGGSTWRGRNNMNFGGRGGVNKRFQSNQYSNRNSTQQWRDRDSNRTKTKETPGKRLSEIEIGVTRYISDHKGFTGVIKTRYSDFQVSEINLNGEIAKLTDLKAPEPQQDEIKEDEDLLLSKYNLELLPMETWDKINKLALSTQPTNEIVEVDVTGKSKEHRTKVHDAVKKAFGDYVVGSTVTKEDTKLVCFEKFRAGARMDTRVKWSWPHDYVHFVVYKENFDTMEVARHIAEKLQLYHVKPSMLGYAGTKDRRGKTTQWFSLRRIHPLRIEKAGRAFRDVKVGNFTFSDKHLKLGDLKGNKFRIALRNVTTDEEIVNKACEDLKQLGFINYYGLQRFGTRFDTPTFTIGLKLLQGNFKEAIDLILDEHEGPLEAALAKYKETGDATQACQLMRKYCFTSTVEGRLLKALATAPNDLIGALNKMARNTRLLYVHSYQSLVWNQCVSERIQRFGLTPVVGDLVLDETGDYQLENTEEGREENEIENEEGDEQKDDSEPLNEEAEPLEKPIITGKAKIPVHMLTQEDIDAAKYTISDIIMPLPGFNVDYPSNMVEYYRELLTKDNLTLDMRHKVRSYCLSGAYRHVVVRPTDMTWSLVGYQNPFGDLILSDWDEITKKQLTSIVPNGKYKALLLTMCLPASCYATMALRELLKVDTSCDFQALQNNYHKTPKKSAKKREDKDGGGEVEAEKRKCESESESDSKRAKPDDAVDA